MIIANWKSNGELMMIQDWTSDFINSCSPKDFYIGIAPPVIYISDFSSLEWDLDTLEEKSNNKIWDIKIGAQDVDHSSGSRTGAVAIKMFEDFGIDFAIIGHSERRLHFNETDNDVNIKLTRLLENEIIPILCFGESLEQRSDGSYLEFIKNQINDGLKGVRKDKVNKLVLAYEPIWAIGTGEVASIENIVEVLDFVKDLVSDKPYFSDETVKLIYGGSVSPDNSSEILNTSIVDGALVGGASLDADKFVDIIKSVNL